MLESVSLFVYHYLYMCQHLQVENISVCITVSSQNCAHMKVGIVRVSSPAKEVKPSYQPLLCGDAV